MTPDELQPSLLLHVQYSMNMLNVPVLIKQNRSSPTMPGSPMKAQLRKYRHSPFTFCRIFRHIVALTPGKCCSSATCLQSVIDRVLLSNGSAHFGSLSERHSQHLMDRPFSTQNASRNRLATISSSQRKPGSNRERRQWKT